MQTCWDRCTLPPLAAATALLLAACGAAAARPSSPLSSDSLHLAQVQPPCLFTTVVLSAPREDGAAQLQVTLSGLLATGVVRIHLMWGKHEDGGLPEDVRAVCAAFRAAGMAIAEHLMERELWERTRGPWRCVHNANYFSALAVAAAAAPGLPVLVLEDDVQLASFFSLRLCRLVGQIARAADAPPHGTPGLPAAQGPLAGRGRGGAGATWAVTLMNPFTLSDETPSDLFPRAAPGLFRFSPGAMEGFYGNQGMVYSPAVVPNLTDWFYHHAVGTKGHPGETDKPMDYTLREYMLATREEDFFIVQDALVQHIGLKSSLGGNFWTAQSFLDAWYVRTRPGRPAGTAAR